MDGLAPHSTVQFGPLILVVGASGVGKDSVLSNSKVRLQDDKNFVFVRRYITRPADAGGEDHLEISCHQFAEDAANGRFSLYWHAHGNDYGLPNDLTSDLKSGKCVLANASRTTIPEAQRQFPNTHVINITATQETILSRLKGRGRESEPEISKRLKRHVDVLTGKNIHGLPNDGSLDLAVARFTTLVQLISLGFQQDDTGSTFLS